MVKPRRRKETIELVLDPAKIIFRCAATTMTSAAVFLVIVMASKRRAFGVEPRKRRKPKSKERGRKKQSRKSRRRSTDKHNRKKTRIGFKSCWCRESRSRGKSIRGGYAPTSTETRHRI